MYLFVSCIYFNLFLLLLFFFFLVTFPFVVLQVKFSICYRCQDCSKPARERQDVRDGLGRKWWDVSLPWQLYVRTGESLYGSRKPRLEMIRPGRIQMSVFISPSSPESKLLCLNTSTIWIRSFTALNETKLLLDLNTLCYDEPYFLFLQFYDFLFIWNDFYQHYQRAMNKARLRAGYGDMQQIKHAEYNKE